MRSSCWIIILALGVIVTGVLAEEAPTALTESVAVQLALQNQPAVRMAQAEAGMARARVGMARAEAALQISANAVAGASNMISTVAVPAVMPQALLESQNRTSADLNAMAMLPLFTGGRIRQAIRAAELSASASESGVATARLEVALEARMRFSEWRQAIAMAAVAQDTLTAEKWNAEVAQQLFDVGKAPKFDLLRAQAARAEAQQQLANAQAELTAARARLAQALAVPEETLGAPAEEPLAEAPAQPLETALARRPELLAAQQMIAAQEAAVNARKANYKPQVYGFGMADSLAPADMGKSSGFTVGVVIGLPILDGGRRRSEVEEAQQAVALARAMRENIELQVRAEVAGAEARVKAARQNIDTAATQVTAADEAYAVAQARYAAGKGTIVELLDAQQARTEARESLVTAQAQYRSTLAELYRAMGVDAL